jgi:hypothetical protein
MYFLLFNWAFKTLFVSICKTARHFLCLPWFFFTACLALFSEFYPRSDVHILRLFAMFVACGMLPALSIWRGHWWNVEIFLQWMVPNLLLSHRI